MIPGTSLWSPCTRSKEQHVCLSNMKGGPNSTQKVPENLAQNLGECFSLFCCLQDLIIICGQCLTTGERTKLVEETHTNQSMILRFQFEYFRLKLCV